VDFELHCLVLGRDEEVILVELKQYEVAWYHVIVFIVFSPHTIHIFADVYSCLTYDEEHGSFSAFVIAHNPIIVPFQFIVPLAQQQPKLEFIDYCIHPHALVGAI
jgi:hypothetical protein